MAALPQSSLPPDLRRVPAWALAIIVVGVIAYVMLFVLALVETDTSLLHGLAIAPVLLALTAPIALRIARRDGDPTLASIIMAGVVAKLLAAWIRHWVAFDYYGGRADARQYHEAAQVLAPDFRSLDFSAAGSLAGTNFIKVVTGIVYAITGTSTESGFFVFAWLGTMGLLLMARAFKLGVPEGNPRRYLIIVLFLPSLMYWPSAIGKEAWMMIVLALSAYGIAAIFRGRSDGVVWLALGLVGCTVVRPHLGLIVFVGIVMALLLRRAPARSYAAPFFRVLGLVAVLVIGLVLAGRTASFLGQPSLTADTVSEQLTDTQERTTDGGSAFSPVVVNTPFDMVPATITVFFRPFPFEVSSVQELATAAEGMLLILLLFASRNRLRSIPRLMRTTPYVAFCVGYLLAFVFAFSSFANFGILARQRSQALPFLLVFLALPRFRDLVAADESTPAEPATTAPQPVPVAPRRRTRRPIDPATRPPSGMTVARAAPKRRAGPARRRRVDPRTGLAIEKVERSVISTGSAFAPPQRRADTDLPTT